MDYNTMFLMTAHAKISGRCLMLALGMETGLAGWRDFWH
jgi:hypothetical protein